MDEQLRWLDGLAQSDLVRAPHARAGLVTLGMTATCEFGLAPHCEPAVHGPMRNPWDTSRATSGSSAGSTAAVAAGIVRLAHGNDLGGAVPYGAGCSASSPAAASCRRAACSSSAEPDSALGNTWPGRRSSSASRGAPPDSSRTSTYGSRRPSAARFLIFDAEYANITGGPAMSGHAILPLAVAVLGHPGDDARLMALAAQLEVARPLARASPCSTRARAARVFEPFSASCGFRRGRSGRPSAFEAEPLDDLVSWTFPERTGP